ncbi:hypothetical protein A2767_04050 [Candidatus Roizmanbacteria bacterium RIFCSPHIGHO2_01_FULL_35_10]|uniref:Uncharacterized protein n=1 Tax=Candidatus Roizmanbacteria bacterium RIFCSPLOWO2_01_FULL_35_13 TaxID=1802055 RepID=A0A1F7IFJ8_9BACT|nr:MAG: hypothetical protein A2767_04050 [Candidatus Roizmanbacteria bacterium RIFCSPHIGHO2_01_FULL_35_10]OGK42125.1 MAG: hypothetical protein A3A74_04780 [Candidatus Roizmanbacteria bacterium RIFCSPLOWO2_01_FULL_35_13]
MNSRFYSKPLNNTFFLGLEILITIYGLFLFYVAWIILSFRWFSSQPDYVTGFIFCLLAIFYLGFAVWSAKTRRKTKLSNRHAYLLVLLACSPIIWLILTGLASL